ncbi:MAG: fluoride efflux transporter CrcB [Nakamurella sp.]
MNAAAAGARRRRESLAVVGVIGLGGAIGSLLRYQAGVFWPTPIGTFPSTTLLINVLGCLVIGGFMIVITEIWDAHRLVRPFFGTGVLGGFTTFSTYSLDVVNLVRLGHPASAALYLFLTAIGAMLAVALGMLGTRRLARARRKS